MGAANNNVIELMYLLIKGEVYEETIERIRKRSKNKAKECENFINRLRVLQQQFGKKHLVKDKKISDKTFSIRWQRVHQVAVSLYALGFYLKEPTKITRKHCIALCKGWEAAGYTAGTLANKKTGLRTILAWSGRESVIDDIKLEDLFENPKSICRPTKTTVDKSMSAALSEVDLQEMFGIEARQQRTLWVSSPLLVLDHLHEQIRRRKTRGMKNKQLDEKCVLMLELMYWFGLRTREAAFFSPRKDIAHDVQGRILHIHVRKQGAKGTKTRRVQIYDPRQVQILRRLKQIPHIKDKLMPCGSESIKAWLDRFYRFTTKNGLTKENNMHPYSLRHEFAQSLLEFYTGEPSPVRSKSVTENKRVLSDAKRIVSEQLGHYRPHITGAYTG